MAPWNKTRLKKKKRTWWWGALLKKIIKKEWEEKRSEKEEVILLLQKFTSLLFFSCSFSSSSLLVLLLKSYQSFKRDLKKKAHHMWLGFVGWCIGWSSHVGVQSFDVEGRNQLLISMYVLAFITYKHPIPYLLLMFGINWFSRSGVRKNNLNSNYWIFKELNAKLNSKSNISTYWVTTLHWKTIILFVYYLNPKNIDTEFEVVGPHFFQKLII